MATQFGTISHGTLRTDDLLEAFADELEHQCAGLAQAARYADLIAEARGIDPDDERAQDVLADLMDALQDFAPPYGFFGAHPGDGSDFGYWIDPFSLDDSFDGLRVADTSEVPADYNGEVLHVNDHGNATLYIAANGELREVWSIV